MKKHFNIIQIKGIKGLLYIGFIGICLAAGFIWFPSWSAMKLWNLAANYTQQIPQIGIIQGILLWGIVVASYFTFRKDKLVVCMRGEEGLTEEELKAVFSEMREAAKDNTFLLNMLKARETELRIKKLEETNIPKVDNPINQDEKIKTK